MEYIFRLPARLCPKRLLTYHPKPYTLSLTPYILRPYISLLSRQRSFCPKSVIFEQTSSFGVGDVPTGIFLQGTPCLVILYIRFVCDGPAILRKTQTGTELLA